MDDKPRLRPLDFQPITHEGQQMWLLNDPLNLSEQQLIMPQALAQMLLFCDGAHSIAEIHQGFCQRLGQNLPLDLITDSLARLDEALLLDNDRSQQALEALKASYRNQSYRPPAYANRGYPGTPQALADMLNEYGRDDDLSEWKPWRGRGIISPHIDFQRGGPVYSKVWQRAKTAVLEADLVIIFGTDHKGGLGTFTLTRLPYATPYGVLPADHALINKLVDGIGEEAAFAEELHHQQEHSIELTAVWLHHIYREAGIEPKPMLPILIGSFQEFVHKGTHPSHDPQLMTAINILKKETKNRKVLAVASVDFAHVGPEFGDNYTMTEARREQLRQTDDFLVRAIVQGNDASFYDQIAGIQNSNKVCGFSPIYLMLRYLETTEGVQVAYDQCSADPANESLVSIAGVLLE
ncbi:MAG: AmmeMemoRadiSam system protein B [Chloroflexota bacterium]